MSYLGLYRMPKGVCGREWHIGYLDSHTSLGADFATIDFLNSLPNETWSVLRRTPSLLQPPIKWLSAPAAVGLISYKAGAECYLS